MRVQVTKDSWGVSVWFSDIKLAYERPDFTPSKPFYGGGFPGHKRLGKDPIWIQEKMYWFRKTKPLSDKFVKEHFPNLGSDMAVGDLRNMDLTIA